ASQISSRREPLLNFAESLDDLAEEGESRPIESYSRSETDVHAARLVGHESPCSALFRVRGHHEIQGGDRVVDHRDRARPRVVEKSLVSVTVRGDRLPSNLGILWCASLLDDM